MEILFNTKKIDSSEPIKQLKEFKNRNDLLKDMKVDEIVDLFDEISKYLSSKNCQIKDLLVKNELGFIIFWLKKSNIKKILDLNFEDYKLLDSPKYLSKKGSIIYAKPLGLAVHWIAGNVPILGVISLFQTVLTKNKSIVKVPESFKFILSDILIDIKESNFFNRKIKDNLNILLDSILVLYISRDDLASQEEISKISDIRVAWGGLEAVENIVGLPKKLNTRDIIFGPKISVSFITKNSIKNKKDLVTLSKGIADDVFAFNQAGCNAPHNIILEKGFKFSFQEFINILKIEFEKKTNKAIINIDPMLTFNLLVRKFLYQSDECKKVHQGKNNQWNIFVNHSEKIEALDQPIFSRNIFISKVSSIEELGKLLPINIQSIGLKVEESLKVNVIKTLSNYGADRFPEIGKMSLYQHPWDGYLPLQQTIKWISTN